MARGTLTVCVIFALVLSAAPVYGQQSTKSRLDQVGGSGVSGTANLTFTEPDTRAKVELENLDPGQSARVTVHSGTCESQSASFVALPDVAADSEGHASADGLLLFQGREPVELTTLADGEHSISVTSVDTVVACGLIPRPGEDPPPAAEEGDSEPPWFLFAGVATGLLLVGAAAMMFAKKRKPAK